MKNLAILAVILGVLANAANAQSAVNSAPNLTLAFNAEFSGRWLQEAPDQSVESSNEVDAMTSAIERVSEKLNKELEDKIAQEFDYAMQ